jgi:chondroitin synthase
MARSNDYCEIETLKEMAAPPYCGTVSIVIPTYSCRSILAKTLAAVTLQTYPRHLMEVVITDDGSDDGIEDLVQQYESDLSIQLVRQEHVGYRLATARNRGIVAAANEVIVSIDCDVLPLPELVEQHMRWFHVSNRVATIGPRRFVDTSSLSARDVLEDIDSCRQLLDIPSVSNRGRDTDKRLPEFVDFKHHPHPYNCFHGGNVAYTRGHALEAGLYDEEFNLYWGYEDLEFGYRLWNLGLYLAFEPLAVGLHQENRVTTSWQRESGARRNLALLYRKVPGLRDYRESLDLD